MKVNVGGFDRGVRVLVGLAFLTAGILVAKPAGLVTVLVAAGGIALLTGIFSFCPAYHLLGIRTCPVKQDK